MVLKWFLYVLRGYISVIKIDMNIWRDSWNKRQWILAEFKLSTLRPGECNNGETLSATQLEQGGAL